MSSKPSKRRLERVGGRQERNEREFSVAVFIVGQKYFFWLPYGAGAIAPIPHMDPPLPTADIK